MVRPTTLYDWVTRVTAAAAYARFVHGEESGWSVKRPARGGALAKDILKGYTNAYEDAAKAGTRDPVAEKPPHRTPITEERIRTLWALAASSHEKRLVRAYSLSRTLLTRPSEILIQHTGPVTRTKDREKHPCVLTTARHIKVGGAEHDVGIWSDEREGDPDGVLDPVKNWEALRAGPGETFGTALLGRTFPTDADEETRAKGREELTAMLRQIADRAPEGTITATLSWYDGRHSCCILDAFGAAAVAMPQGNWKDTRSSGTYRVPPRTTQAVLGRRAHRAFDKDAGGPPAGADAPDAMRAAKRPREHSSTSSTPCGGRDTRTPRSTTGEPRPQQAADARGTTPAATKEHRPPRPKRVARGRASLGTARTVTAEPPATPRRQQRRGRSARSRQSQASDDPARDHRRMARAEAPAAAGGRPARGRAPPARYRKG